MAGSAGANARGTSVLRQINTVAVLKALRSAGSEGARVVELAEATRLTRPTITQSIEALVANGVVAEASPPSGPRTMGRPAARYRLRKGLSPVLGLDIGPHRLSASVSEVQGPQLAARASRLRVGQPDEEVKPRLRRLVDAVLADAGLTVDDLATVVAGSPGVIGQEHDRVELVPSAAAWIDAGVFDELTRRFGDRVVFDNDANLAAVAAASEFPGRTLLAVHWGERLGAGIVIDGRIHHGAHRAAGEIGMIATSKSGLQLDEEGRGPLEHELGAGGIVRRAQSALAKRPGSRLATYESLTSQDVFVEAQRGDPVATAVTADVARAMIWRLAPVVLALDPDLLVLSGGVARAGEFLVAELSKSLSRYVLAPPEVRLSAYAHEAVLEGALASARNRAWKLLEVDAAMAAGSDSRE